LAKNNCSIVVNDPKGELLEATGAFFKKNGFALKVLNPENKDNSDRFNVFLNCKRDAEIDKIAQVLVTASSN
jgi:type IV secretion system protein VirD4